MKKAPFISNSIQLIACILIIFNLQCSVLAQSTEYRFESAFNNQSDHIFYYSKDKKNKFNTVYTSVFEINTLMHSIYHKKGNNLRTKKAWIESTYPLQGEELEAFLNISSLKHLPEKFKKYYKSLRNRPINTFYYKSPTHEIFIQWEGSNPPKKRIFHKLNHLYGYLTEVVNSKR